MANMSSQLLLLHGPLPFLLLYINNLIHVMLDISSIFIVYNGKYTIWLLTKSSIQ